MSNKSIENKNSIDINHKNSANQKPKEILTYLISPLFSKFNIKVKENQKNINLKVFISKSDYNFILRNKILMVSIKAIVMAYGAKINKKINIDFLAAK